MRRIFPIILVLLATLYWLSQPGIVAARGSLPQITFQTPTPGADGRILYTVKEGETCLSISLLSGLSVDELRQLNNLTGDCIIAVNSTLLLGIQTPAAVITNTPGPSPTPTPILPTATPVPGTGNICILLYDDANGNGMRDTSEAAIADGQVNLTDADGKTSLTETTLMEIDPITEDYALTCFEKLFEGTYNISVAIPNGYNPTTELNSTLSIKAGDSAQLNFGAQINSSAETQSPSDGGKNPILGVLGGLVLLVGVGLGVYVKFFKK